MGKMETKMRTKSALSYFGSDSEVAADLAAMLDHCKHVTIPFCGGMSILPHLKAKGIVANDLNDLAINFYNQALARTGRLAQMCCETLSHPATLERARWVVGAPCSRFDELERAWAYWAICWVGRGGAGGTENEGRAASVRWTADGGNNASRIHAVGTDLHKWAAEFRRCEFTCLDFRAVLAKVKDTAESGVYVDAPWRVVGKYRHGFQDGDHRDLAELLGRFKATTIVVRYGDDPLIRDLYDGWNIIERDSRTQANKRTGELWITNREVC